MLWKHIIIIETFILRFDIDTDHVNLQIIEDIPSKLRKIWEYMLTKELFEYPVEKKCCHTVSWNEDSEKRKLFNRLMRLNRRTPMVWVHARLLGRVISVLIKALVTLDILAHNISIKRYCDKKIILSHGFQLAMVSS